MKNLPFLILLALCALSATSSFAQGPLSGTKLTIGSYCTASGQNSTAMGSYSCASGTSSMAIGYGSLASGENSVAMGRYSSAFGECSIAIGAGNAYADYSFAGAGSRSYGWGSFSFGNSYTAGDYSVAIGMAAEAYGYSAIALGVRNGAYNFDAVALNCSYSYGSDSFSANYGSASGDGSAALGEGYAAGYESVAQGRGSVALWAHEVVIGKWNDPVGDIRYAETDADDTNRDANAPLFIIGNGNGEENRRNTFVITRNGAITMQPQGDISMGEFAQ